MRKGKSGILAQNPTTQARRRNMRWLLAASAIPMFAIITAFGLAPQTADQNVAVTTVTEAVALPLQNISAAVDAPTLWQADQIRRDDTFPTLLNRLNIRNPQAIDFLSHAPEASALPSQLRPGRTILVKTKTDGSLVELLYQTGSDTALHVLQHPEGYQAMQVGVALENRTLVRSAEIQSSLFAATDVADIPDHIAMQLAEIFSSEIDFNLDLRKGDRFSVVYEASYHDGDLVKSGQVLAAEFINQGKIYRAVLHRDHEGHLAYYTPEGKSLRKSFLRSPLEFSRISSGFSVARFHPVLQQWRAHKGVDYAAPIGTRIKSTSDATVSFVGSQSGYGNVVILQHAGDISTVYGHLSHFAPGLHKGQKILQGDIIGQVGMSGMATGPHLHYEFRVHGEHRNPLTVALPTSIPLGKSEMTSFLQYSRPLFAQLDLLNRTLTASLE